MFWESKYRKGMKQYLANDYVNAIQNLAKAIQSEKLDKSELNHALNMMISSFFVLEQYDEAITVLKSAVQCDDYDKSEVFFSLAIAYERKENYELSLNYLEKSIELKPDNNSSWMHKGVVLCNLNRYDEAEEAYKTALKYADTSTDYQIRDRLKRLPFEKKLKIALDLQNNGKFADAINIYDSILESIESNSDTIGAYSIKDLNVIVLTNKGSCLNSLNRHDEAIEALKKAVEIIPDNTGLYVELAWTCLQTQMFDDAIKYYEEAIKYAEDEISKNTYYFIKKITYFQKLIHNREYQAALNEANSIPEINDSIIAIKTTLKGVSLFYLEKYDEALNCLLPNVEDDLIDTITGNKSVHAMVYAAVGGVYYKQGQYETALKYLNKSIQHNGERFTEIWSWVFMGESYIAIGEYEKAVEALQKTVETRKDGDDYDLAYLESRLKFAKEKLGDSADKDGEAESLICPNCGSKLNSDDSFCGKCGSKLK